MSSNDGFSAGQTMGRRPIFVDPASNCLCTTNPANGQVVWIVDPETGQPLPARQVYSDPASGCLCSVDPVTNKVSWIIDPATGRPMVGPQGQPAAAAPQQTADVQQPVEEPWAPTVEEAVQQPAEEPWAPSVEDVAQPVGEQWAPAVEEPVQQPIEEPWVPAVEEVAQPVGEQWIPAVEEPVQQPVEEPWVPAGDESLQDLSADPMQGLVDEPWVPVAEETAQQPLDSLLPAVDEVVQTAPAPVEQPEVAAMPVVETAAAAAAVAEPAPAFAPTEPAPQPEVKAEAPAQAKPSPEPAPAPASRSISNANKPVSIMAVISLIIGLLGIAAAVIPLFVDVAGLIPGGNNTTTRIIVNNSAFGFAIVGLILALIGTHGIQAGRKKGKTAAILGVLFCVLSVVIVLLAQYLFPQAFNDAANKVTSTSGTPAASVQQSSAASSTTTASSSASASASASTSSSASASASSASSDQSAMALGQTVKLNNGLAVTVNSAQFNLENFDGTKVTMVNVSYKNEGTSNRPFNVYDWKALDSSGALRSETYYSEATKELQSGELAPGGSVTGNVYFEGNATKVYYYDNIVETESKIGWVLQ